jgi:hypothetical protein
MAAQYSTKQATASPPQKQSAPVNDAPTLEPNARWQSLVFGSFGIKPKLAVSRADDPDEREADRIADQVLSASAWTSPAPASNGTSVPHIQRKCAECEEEETLHRKAEPATGATTVPDHFVPPSGAGHPLDGATRRFFEPRFGADFSQVRLHTDHQAAESARAVNALAYTIGRDIAFGSGQYAPDSARGRRLLAHELAHVTQGGAPTLRRASGDYEIETLSASAGSDTDSIFFERGSETIPASEATKITALATPASRNLTLHGFASEDASAADRALRVTGRLNAVETALAGAGHTGTRTRVPHPDEGLGDVDYRHRRRVEVRPSLSGGAPAPTTVNPCNTAGSEVATGAALTACETAFTTAQTTAVAAVDAAERDVVTTPTAAANAVVNQFFSGVPRAAVNANLSAIAAQVRQLPTRHRCHTSCDGGCGRPAYNSGRGLGATGSMMTLCPDFVTASLPFRIKTLIHEAAHANPVESIEDVAYASTRLIPFLLPADARRNTDSYVLLIRLVHSPGSMTFGPITPDVMAGMTATGAGSDTEQSQRAVAWLESWLNYGDFDTEILYSTIHNSLVAGAWITTGSNEFNIQTMNRLATAFAPDLTDPGADGSPRTTPPTEADKLRVAAIHDRFDQMYDVVNYRVLTVTRTAAGGAESWGSQTALPRLNQSVTVAPTFFALTPVEQVRHLVRLMARARTDITSTFEEKYVDALDLIRRHRRLGP